MKVGSYQPQPKMHDQPDPSKWLPWLSIVLSVLAIALGSYNVVTTAYTGLSTQDNRISNLEASQSRVLEMVVGNVKAIAALDTLSTSLLSAIKNAVPCQSMAMILSTVRAPTGWTPLNVSTVFETSTYSYYINNCVP